MTEDRALGNWLFVIGYWTFAFSEYPIINIQCPMIKYKTMKFSLKSDNLESGLDPRHLQKHRKKAEYMQARETF